MSTESDSSCEVDGAEVDRLRKALALQTERNLRLAADLKNYKRRTRSESAQRALAQKESFLLELLPAIDDLERALESGRSANTLEFYQGVELIHRVLLALLRRHGVDTEDTLGQPFDPHRHEAVAVSCDRERADGTVLKVYQRGYWREGRIIRPAKVEVNDLTHSDGVRHVG